MVTRVNWTEEELVLALVLYLRTPYQKITSKNPEIVALANSLGRTPGAVSYKLANFAFCDKKVADSGKKGFSNGSKLDRVIWNQYVGENYEHSIEKLLNDAQVIADERNISINVFLDQLVPNDYEANKTEYVRTQKVRLYQDYFRAQVLQRYDSRCLVSGLRCRTLLEVAHVIPWADDPNLRLVTTNGIPLNPLIHKAYDKHLLGIDSGFVIHVSEELLSSLEDGLLSWFRDINGSKLRLRDGVSPNPEFLAKRFETYKLAQ